MATASATVKASGSEEKKTSELVSDEIPTFVESKDTAMKASYHYLKRESLLLRKLLPLSKRTKIEERVKFWITEINQLIVELTQCGFDEQCIAYFTDLLADEKPVSFDESYMNNDDETAL